MEKSQLPSNATSTAPKLNRNEFTTAASPPVAGITSELVQTSVSLIRNEKREIIGTEVLHLCRAEDESIFVIDDSAFDEPHDSEL